MDADDRRDYSLSSLEQWRYRDLQKLAKSLKLPSNVKKVYLVQLIHASKCLSQDDVDSIVQMCRMERLAFSHDKKTNQYQKTPRKHMQVKKEMLTSTKCSSPPIDSTPKRNMRHRVPHYERKTSSIEVESPQSDRVLRNKNARNHQKPKYALFDGDVVFGVIASRKTNDPNEPLCIVRSRQPLRNPGGPRPLRNHRLRLLNSQLNSEGQKPMSVVPYPKLQIKLSGVHPTSTQVNFSQTNEVQIVRVRHEDGTISKINSLVPKTTAPDQKPPVLVQKNKIVYKQKYVKPQTSFSNVDVQDVIDARIDSKTIINTISERSASDTSYYPNMSAVAERFTDNALAMIAEETDICESTEAFTVYQHNQNVTSHTQVSVDKDFPDFSMQQPLPTFTKTFKGFRRSYDHDLMRPLYIQVNEEPNNTVMAGDSHRCLAEVSTIQLETFYTFKREGESRCARAPPNAATTHCVDTAATCTTAFIHPPCARPAPQTCPSATYHDHKTQAHEVAQVDNLQTRIEYDLSLHDYCKTSSVHYTWGSESTVTDATIPELMEDALEYMSQDGDYLERITMDERMSCVLCSWAGPKFVLEFHIRAEHADQIVSQCRNAWNTTTKLSSLVNQEVWLSHVVELDNILYILSLKYEEPDCLMVTLTNLTAYQTHKSGIITIYNKVTAEPYSWRGEIQDLPSSMPYSNPELGLKLNISSLELLPNGANMNLVDSERILMSPVVGKTDLDDVHIIVFVNIFDTVWSASS